MSDHVLENYAAERLTRVHSSRTFEFEGVRFTYKPAVPVEILDRFISRDGTIEEITQICDEVARACLEDPAAWDAVRSPDHQPLILDYAGIVWLTDQILTRSSGLPTEQPAVSSAGQQGPTATTSSGGSSSAAGTPTS